MCDTLIFSLFLLSKKNRVNNSLHPWSEQISLVEERISLILYSLQYI